MKYKHHQAMLRAKRGRWQIRNIFKPEVAGTAFDRRAGAMAHVAMLWGMLGRRNDFIVDTWAIRKGATP